MSIEIIADYACHCGEGPTWHPTQKCLYWNDNETTRFFRYDPATGEHKPVYTERTVAASTLQDDGTMILYMDRGTVAAFRNGAIEPLIEEIPDERDTRFNDVIADPVGRVFAGTMPAKDRPGRLYRIDKDLTWHVLLEGINCPNGMGFTPDLKTFYFTDTFARQIVKFDYDVDTGAISNRRPFIEFAESDGFPDGMTTDTDDCIWTALWSGGCVQRYSPNAELMQRIDVPAKGTTCPVFGGEDMTHMYITCAGGEDKAANGPDAGALFRIDLGPDIKGVPEFRSRLGE